MPQTAAKPRFWNDFVDPTRTVEATTWIQRFPQEVLAGRGERGETALHWAALANIGLVTDLLAIGMDINIPDARGRTALDWQNSRLWYICIEREGPMSEGGRFHVRQQSQALIEALWRLGGRPGMFTDLDPTQVWTRAGLWTLVRMRQDTPESRAERHVTPTAPLPLAPLRNLGRARESALHGWVMAAEAPEKHRTLDQWLADGLQVDEPDAQGRTPLWYAVDGLIARPAWHRIFLPSIRALLDRGANPDQADALGVSPRQRAVSSALADADATRLMAAFGQVG